MKTLKAVVAKYNQTSLILRILIGLAVGSVLALVAPGAGWVGELGSLFVGALKGIAPVLVFIIVASALAQGTSRLDRRFGTVIWLYMLTTFLAAAIAVVTSFLFPQTIVLAEAAESEVVPQGLGEVMNTLLTNFVANPVSALLNGNYIGILFWACMFGIAMKKIGAESTKVFLANTADAVSQIVRWIINLAPFDQTRREVARMTLERLIGDGRIHPARIEETVEKCRHDLELQMKREGERAVMELGIHGLHPDLIKLIGRLKYRTSFGQNALTHSMEVAWVAGLLAGEMGVNVTMARRAGLLHDIGKALDHEIEGSHVQIGVDICRKYKENTQIIHAIEAHHGDVEPKTPLAFIIQAADAISAARPGARRENVESYVKRLENLEEISSSFEGVEQAFAVQAGREVRILVKPDVISDDQVILLARAIAKKIEDTLDYPGQIKVNVIRESRAVEYAK